MAEVHRPSSEGEPVLLPVTIRFWTTASDLADRGGAAFSRPLLFGRNVSGESARALAVTLQARGYSSVNTSAGGYTSGAIVWIYVEEELG